MSTLPRNLPNGDGASHPANRVLRDTLPPQNLEAERSVLGACLLDAAVIDDVLPLLTAEDFYRDTHQAIWARIVALRDGGHQVDSLILAEDLERRGELDTIGGTDAIAELINAVPHSASAIYHAQIVRQKAIARRLLEAHQESIREILTNGYTATELCERSEGRIFAVSDRQASGETVPIGRALDEAMVQIRERAEGIFRGVPTGFLDLDAMLVGLRGGQLIVVGARPSIGKSQFGLNIAQYVAMEQGIGVLFISLEMGQEELSERLLISAAGVDGYKVQHASLLSDREWQALEQARAQLDRIWLDDTAVRSATAIAANALRLKARKDIRLVIVDYLQLIEPTSDRESRNEQISRISRRLKLLAKQLDLPVVVLSQLNRQPEKREGNRPRMADLRDSGSIEQDADVVLLLHRPDYYDPDDQPGITEVIVAKNRNGRTGTVRLHFDRARARFQSLAEPEPDFGPPPPANGGPF